MPSLNNPAGRLGRLLEMGLSSGNLHNEPHLIAWSHILNIPARNQSLLIPSILEVYELPQLIVTAINKHPDIESNIYLTWHEQAHNCLKTLNFDSPFKNSIQHIDKNVLAILKICDDTLSRISFEPILDTQRVDNLLKKIRRLVHEVSQSDVDDNLKSHLLRHLILMEQSTCNYYICGLSSFKRGFEASVGSMVLNKSEFDEAIQTKYGNRFLRIALIYSQLITGAYTTLALPHQVTNLLPSRNATIAKDNVQVEQSSDPQDHSESSTQE